MDESGQAPLNLARMRVVFTGRLLYLSRAEAGKAVETGGGVPSRSVSRRTGLLVVGMGGWPLLPDGQVSHALRRAEHLNENGARIRILSEAEFVELIGRKAPRPQGSKQYSADEICQLAGISGEKLRRWEHLGLVRPSAGRYDFRDIVSLQRLTDLVGRGVRPELIARSLRGLESILPQSDRPLAQLDIIIENKHSLVADLNGIRLTHDGQLVLNFDSPNDEDAGVTAQLDDQSVRDDDWFQQAQELEEREEYDAAAKAYRNAIARDPSSAEAFFNLGNVLRAVDRSDSAMEMYRIAVALDPELVEAWYNLADILEDYEDYKGAIDHLQRAVSICPSFADAYYNLALCFERLGAQQEARQGWSQYLQLDPDSEWAGVARAHLAHL